VPVAELGSPSPTRHWAASFETGVDYAVVVSSCAGLFGYVLGDTVRFVERAPAPRLLVTGRISYSLSAFGEHLDGAEIDAAAMAAAREAGVAIAEYCVGPVFGDATGHHLWLVEPVALAPAGAAGRMADALDAALRAENDDYRAHRNGRQLGMPEVALLPPGAFADWMRAEGRLGGQHKVPRVVADPERFEAMAEALLGARGAGGGQPPPRPSRSA
jgi:hypothetical protein